MATHSVIGAQPFELREGKQAEATFMSKSSGEKALLVDLEAVKSWSSEVPSASFLRSISRVGASKDKRSIVESSHSRTTASSVMVTRQLPLTPRGCHSALTIADLEVT